MSEDRLDNLEHKLGFSHDVPENPGRLARALMLPVILRILSEGKPASAHDVSQIFDLPAPLVAAAISHVFPDVKLDASGYVTGIGLSLKPTPHAVLLKGYESRSLYAWCAQDALLLPSLMGEYAQITSLCRATGQTVTVEVGADSVTSVQPASAAVSFMVKTDPTELRLAGCDNQHFFISSEAAEAWLVNHPQAFVVPVTDAFHLVTRLGKRAFGTAAYRVDDIGDALATAFMGKERDEVPCRLITREENRAPANTGQPEPGDMWWDTDLAGRWDSQVHKARGGGPHLVVRLPNGWDWDIDGFMSNGSGWERAGKPPEVTAFPSIIAGDYHGFLMKGKLIRAS